MALYVSRATRLRRTLIAVAIAAIVAFAAGLLIGRSLTASVSDRVASTRTAADDIATGIERLDIEYQQVLDGTDSLQTAVLTPLDDLRHELQSAMDRAPWLQSDQRATMLDAIAQVASAAQAGEPIEAFTSRLGAAATAVRSAFGVST